MEVLDRERWREVSLHLDELLELDDTQRDSRVAALCDKDATLAADIRMLLDEHRALDEARFLEDAPTPAAAMPGLAGQTVGPYTLLSPIGHGGMGAVWLAERSDGRFDRRVAVKFLNIALAGRGEERFTREGTLQARLAHPHIARLLDAGVAPSGQPFLVLEHVDGQAIDRYCDTRGLTIDARIVLFLDVLAAVAHAHVNLIVHRDIKPPNVLVDRDGQVKLLDFGIAKLLEEDGASGQASALTRDAGVGLTPEYAAPEQLTGEPVTTATDVYALGVLLYLLLTGRHPAGDDARSPATLMKSIVEVEPPRMSTVAVPNVQRQLRGDLDTIVAKALRKLPNDRYTSVTSLADDLNRYRQHLPIGARRETVWYRATKFVRRNRVGVGAAVLTLTTLSAGVIIANRERMVAERRFTQLRQLANKVIALDRSIRNLAGSTEARRTLVSDSLEYLEGLSSEASGDLDLALETGEAYARIARIQGVPTEVSLGDLAKAEESLKRADALIERVRSARPASRAALLDSAIIAHDRMIVAESEHRNADARTHAGQAAARIEAFLRRSDLTTAERDQFCGFYGNVALAYSNMHMYREAEPIARRTIEIARTLPSSARLGSGLSLLANILRYQGNVEGALQAITEARHAAATGVYENETQRMIETYGVLLRHGLILGEDQGINANRPDEAVAVFQQAIDLTEAAARRDANDSTSRGRVATSAREMGNILRHSDPRRALAAYDLGLKRLGEIRNLNLKARRDTAVLLASSSYPLRALGRTAEAKQRVDKAVGILTQTKDYPPRNLTLDSEAYTVLRAQADSFASEGHLVEATTQYERMRDQLIRSSPPDGDLRVSKKWDAFNQSLDALHASASR